MIASLIVAAAGLIAGFVLIRRFPSVPQHTTTALPHTSIVIPARNEAHNLPIVLASLPQQADVLVIDDHSTDDTATIAAAHHVRILTPPPAPSGWVGKSWACLQGANASASDTLLFLDADTRFTPGGFARILSHFASLPANTALSVLPYHQTETTVEDLSLFFHLLMTFGSTGFAHVGNPQLLGPFLLLPRALYERAGTHAAVQSHPLEHLIFATHIRSAGGHISVLNANGTLTTRMYPGGLHQLVEGWSKAFTTGAGQTSPVILVLSVLWLSAGITLFTTLLFTRGTPQLLAAVGYLAFVTQLAVAARQIGNYRWPMLLLYPIPLIFYLCVFTLALGRKLTGRKSHWRGREL